MQEINYYSIKVREEDKQKLFDIVSRYFNIPDDWKRYADHMTVLHHSHKDFNTVSPYLYQMYGHELPIFINGIGISYNAVALMCSNMSANKHSHITMAVAPGHKPVESNDIKDNEIIWFDKVIPIFGVFTVHVLGYCKDKNLY